MDPNDPSSPNLKNLLEAPGVSKLIYDVRSDASNLSRQFDIRIKGAYDLQVGDGRAGGRVGGPSEAATPWQTHTP